MGILQAVALTAAETEDSGPGPGLYGFLVIVFLIVALFVLYRSMRKQIRKVDFDPDGADDAARMRRHREPPDR